jgi:general secretion pathway protein D
MNRFCVSVLTAALLTALFAMPSGASEADGVGPQTEIQMNFQNVDIPVLAKFVSEITGKNFIIDESVRGKVSIMAPTKVTPEQAYQLFQSVLEEKGFTTQQAGKVIKIVPARNVRSTAQLSGAQQPPSDEYVTRMVRLKNIDAAGIVGAIQPMVSHDGLVAAFPEDNTIIITDDAYNVQRLMEIIGALDVRGEQQNVRVINLRLAFAGELAPEIEQIMNARLGIQGGSSATGGYPRPGIGVVAPATQSSATGFKVIPDERTNSLVVLAPPMQMREIEEIVTQLDVIPPNATSRMHVYRLKNAQAIEMVQVLNNLMNGGSGPSTLSPSTGRGSLGRGSSLGMYNGSSFGSGYGGMSGGYGGMSGMSGTSFGGSSMGGMGGMSGMGGGSMGGGGGIMRGSSGYGGMGGSTSASSSGKSPDFVSPVSITADPATNALVVSAAPQDWQTLKNIIEELDVPRVQVFVQAVIVEVQAARQREIGVNFFANGTLGGNTMGIGALNFGNLQTALGNPLGLTGLGLGLASGNQCSIPAAIAAAATTAVSGTTTGTTSTSSGTVNVPCEIALLTALEMDTHANVLSAPTLLTADNEEAMIVVGQNLPFVGSAAANAGLPGQIFNSVDRQNVGITLDIIPQVSEGDYVKLDLYEEVSNVDPTTVNNTLGPTTTIRSASTAVLVQNHRTAVIGGLLSSSDNINNQGVPYISSIPFLGNLFSDKSRNKAKDNLLVFLTPHIVRNKSDLRELSLAERQNFVNSLGRKEMHDMPASQVKEIYKPSFSIAVPPSAELNAPYGAPPIAPGPDNPNPDASGATPFNTTEVHPSVTTYPRAAAAYAPSSPSIYAPGGYAPRPSSYAAAPAAPPVSAPLDAGAGAVSPFSDAAAGAPPAGSKLDSASGVTPSIAP